MHSRTGRLSQEWGVTFTYPKAIFFWGIIPIWPFLDGKSPDFRLSKSWSVSEAKTRPAGLEATNAPNDAALPFSRDKSGSGWERSWKMGASQSKSKKCRRNLKASFPNVYQMWGSLPCFLRTEHQHLPALLAGRWESDRCQKALRKTSNFGCWGGSLAQQLLCGIRSDLHSFFFAGRKAGRILWGKVWSADFKTRHDLVWFQNFRERYPSHALSWPVFLLIQ